MLICILTKNVITSCSVTMMLFLHLEVKPLMTLTTGACLSCAPPLLGQTPGRAEHAHDNESVKVYALCRRRCMWSRRRWWLDVELVVPQSLVVRKQRGADGWPRWTRRPWR